MGEKDTDIESTCNQKILTTKKSRKGLIMSCVVDKDEAMRISLGAEYGSTKHGTTHLLAVFFELVDSKKLMHQIIY